MEKDHDHRLTRRFIAMKISIVIMLTKESPLQNKLQISRCQIIMKSCIVIPSQVWGIMIVLKQWESVTASRQINRNYPKITLYIFFYI